MNPNEIENCTFSTSGFIVETKTFKLSLRLRDTTSCDGCRTSKRKDLFVPLDYEVIERKRSATNFQIKKFLKRFVIAAINAAIIQRKEIDNG